MPRTSPWRVIQTAYGVTVTWQPVPRPLLGTFTSYASTATLGSSIEVWNVSGGGLNPPEDFYNDTSSVVSYLSITMQPYQAAFHPGPDGEYSVYRFTAPVAGYTPSVPYSPGLIAPRLSYTSWTMALLYSREISTAI